MHARRSSNRFSKLLEQTRQPCYVIDPQRRIVFANPALAAWLDIPLERFLGAVCNYHSRSDADLAQRVAASLCPPPQAFDGVACQGPVGGFLRDAQSPDAAPTQSAFFVPLALESDTNAVLVLVNSEGASFAPDADTGNFDAAPQALHQQIAQWRREIATHFRLDRILGSSSAARAVQMRAKAAVDSRANVWIAGPPGAGAEQLARSIHYAQYAAGAAPPLIPLDCAICDAESLQSALRQVQSDRERSQRGRLLLLQADRMNSEIAHELSGFVAMPGFEVGLLSVGETPIAEWAAHQRIEPPLVQALGVIEISLPPLAERLQDLPLICQSLVENFNAEGNRQISGVSSEALERLREYPWPGNLDELAQVIQASCQNARRSIVQPDDLPHKIRQGIAASRIPRKPEATIELASFLREVENELMRRAIRVSKGNKAKAARLLGVSRQRIIRWSEQNKSDN